MELQSVTLTGYRRFAVSTELKTTGKLVALLGPNEAGKTSILKAISQIGSSVPIPKADYARAAIVSDDDIIIVARFRLEIEDLTAAQLTGPTWYILDKKASGQQVHHFEPKVHLRDSSHRAKLKVALAKVRKNNKLLGRLIQTVSTIPEILDQVDEILLSKKETLSKEEIAKIEEFKELISDKADETDPAYFRDLAAKLLECMLLEKAPTPSENAYSVIFKRVPKFLLFSENDRLLKGSYSVEEVKTAIPSALSNLAKVAGLDIAKLVSAIDDEDTSTIAKLKLQANDALKTQFSENWSQSGVHVAFEVFNGEIQILVQEEGFNFTKLAERSDGLRQFVALQAFTTCERVENPVLLIDEAEMRLHYDAQADLIQMLSRQTVSPKIIYTTHSAGCLPEDLGNGVSLVDYASKDDEVPSSTVRNHFWSREGGGLEPLLFGMGAATLAFFPIRRALLTEGESDMLLLPTMFRECFGSSNLDFQVVPGLSKTSGINLPILARNGKGIAFILDNDPGGSAIKNKIVEASFDEHAVFFLKGPNNTEHQLEDFIDPKLLSIGAHSALSDSHPDKSSIPPSSFRSNGRLKLIASHYGLKNQGEISKTRMAYAILDHLTSNPEKTVVDPQKKQSFERIAGNIRAYLSK
ncbi:AAA family ATPase [Sphingomonas sp. PB2P12]|uniref:AAA family ATPase n=1 Tax=Sphingomonas sandaracina TaxID=3096157 RepID=UPI002FC805E8